MSTGRRFFRIVLTDPPTLWEFTSHAGRGLPARRKDPETLRLWEGMSVYDQRRYARRAALRYPQLGRFIAELHIPDDTPIRAERTMESRGHYTLWGAPAVLLGRVVAVAPVSEGADRQEG